MESPANIARPAGRPWHATGVPIDATVAQFAGRRGVTEALRSQDGAPCPLLEPRLAAIASGRLERIRGGAAAAAPAGPTAINDFL